MAYGQKSIYSITREPKSSNKIFDYNAQQYVALQEGFIMDRIVDARNPNYNLKENLKLESFSVSSV